jgi:hypothetical protein
MSELEKLRKKYPYLDLYDYPAVINSKGRVFQIGEKDTREGFSFRSILAFNVYEHAFQGRIIRAVYGGDFFDTFHTFDDIESFS